LIICLKIKTKKGKIKYFSQFCEILGGMHKKTIKSSFFFFHHTVQCSYLLTPKQN